MTVGIVDTKMSNSKSVYNAIKFLGYDAHFITDPTLLKMYDKVILPGVGSFPAGMKELREMNFIDPIKEFKGDLLGICLGMQLLFEVGYEFGPNKGLGIIPGEVDKNPSSILAPNIGWFRGTKSLKRFYFVHSYSASTRNEFIRDTIVVNQTELVSHVKRDNFQGVQFHPEKSGKEGLNFINNFINE